MKNPITVLRKDIASSEKRIFENEEEIRIFNDEKRKCETSIKKHLKRIDENRRAIKSLQEGEIGNNTKKST